MQQRKWSARSMAFISTAVFAVIVIAVNLLLLDQHRSIDMTADKRLSISPQLIGMVEKLDDTVNITFHVSRKLPPKESVLRRWTEDRLRDLARKAGKSIRLEVIESTPGEDAAEDERLRKLRIFPITVSYRDTRGEEKVQQAYFHLLIQHGTSQQVVAMPPPSVFEYELGKAIVKSRRETLPRVAFIDNTPDSQFLVTASGISSQLLQGLFRTMIVDGSNERDFYLPEDLDVAVVACRRRLTTRQMGELDQFLLHGGKLVVLAEAVPFDDQLIFFRKDDTLPNMNELLRHWGVELLPNMVQDWESSFRVSLNAQARATYGASAPFPQMVIVESRNMNQDIPIMASTQRLLLQYASEVIPAPDAPAELKIDRLLHSTSAADAQTTAPYRMAQPEPGSKAEGPRRSFNLGVRVTGQFRSFFAPGKIPLKSTVPPDDALEMVRWADGAQRMRQQLVSVGNPELWVIGSPHMISNDILREITARSDGSLSDANISFIAGLIESLTIGDDLVTLRSKTVQVSLLDRSLKEEDRDRVKMLGTFATPAVVILLALILAALRAMKLRSDGREFSR